MKLYLDIDDNYVIIFDSVAQKEEYNCYLINERTKTSIQNGSFTKGMTTLSSYIKKNPNLFLANRFKSKKEGSRYLYFEPDKLNHCAVLLVNKKDDTKITILDYASATSLTINGLTREEHRILVGVIFSYHQQNKTTENLNTVLNFGDSSWKSVITKAQNNKIDFNYILYDLAPEDWTSVSEKIKDKKITKSDLKEYEANQLAFKLDQDNFLMYLDQDVALGHRLVLFLHYGNELTYYYCETLTNLKPSNSLTSTCFTKFDGIKLYYNAEFLKRYVHDGKFYYDLNILFIESAEGDLQTVSNIPMEGEPNYEKNSHGISYTYESLASQNYIIVPFPKTTYLKINYKRNNLYTDAVTISLKDIRYNYYFFNLNQIEEGHSFKASNLADDSFSNLDYKSLLCYQTDKKKYFTYDDSYRISPNDRIRGAIFSKNERNYYVPLLNLVSPSIQEIKVKREKERKRVICPACGEAIIPYAVSNKEGNTNKFRYQPLPIANIEVAEEVVCSNGYCNQHFRLLDCFTAKRVSVAIVDLTFTSQETNPLNYRDNVRKHMLELRNVLFKLTSQDASIKNYHVWQKSSTVKGNTPLFINYLDPILRTTQSPIDKDALKTNLATLKYASQFICYIVASDLTSFIKAATKYMQAINEEYNNDPRFYSYLTNLNYCFCYVFSKNNIDNNTNYLWQFNGVVGIDYTMNDVDFIYKKNINTNQGLYYNLALKKLAIRNDILLKYIANYQDYSWDYLVTNFNSLNRISLKGTTTEKEFLQAALAQLNYNFCFGKMSPNKDSEGDINFVFDALIDGGK